MQDKLTELLEQLRELDTALCEAIDESQVREDGKLYEHTAVDLVNKSLAISSELTQLHIETITQHN